MLKDGHVFVVHVLNPREGGEEDSDANLEASSNPAAKTEEPEKAELEKSEKGKHAVSTLPPSADDDHNLASASKDLEKKMYMFKFYLKCGWTEQIYSCCFVVV